jgi:ankyrin repeat protein
MSFIFGAGSILPLFARSAVDYEKCIENKTVIGLRVVAITAVALVAIACFAAVVPSSLPLLLIAAVPLAVTGYELLRSWYFTNSATVDQYMDPKQTTVSTWVLARIGNTKSAAKKLLEQKGFVPEKKDEEGHTALHWCTDPEIADLLLKSGHKPDCKSAAGMTPLHSLMSVQMGQEDNQTKKPAEPVIPIPPQATPIHRAQRSEVMTKLLDTLIEQKIPFNDPFPCDLATIQKGEPPLLAAMKRGYTHQWAPLIDKMLYADPKFLDTYGFQVDAIIAEGLKQKDEKKRGFENLKEAILDFKTLKAYMSSNNVPSNYLARIGNKYSVAARLLEQSDVPIDKTDKDGHTALHWCTNPEIARKLLEKGFDPTAIATNGLTPLQSLMTIQIYQEANPKNNPPEPEEAIPASAIPLDQSDKIGVILELINHLESAQFNAPFPANKTKIPEGASPFVLAINQGYTGGWKRIIDSMLIKDPNIYKANRERLDTFIQELLERDLENRKEYRNLQNTLQKIQP